MNRANMVRSLERIAVAIIVQAVADLADNEIKHRIRWDNDRKAAQRSAWAFLTGQGTDNAWGLAWWCDHIGLDPTYLSALARKIRASPECAAEIRQRISYLGPLDGRTSATSTVGTVEDEAEEAISEETRDQRWHSTILTYISKKGTAGPTP